MKILAIGNSFSQDATAYLHAIASADGYALEVTNLYIGGCSLERHANNIENDAADYLLEQNGESTGRMVSIKDTLISDKWDYVTMQQASYLSNNYATYQPYLNQLSACVREYAPQAEQIIHQTWAYEQDSERLTKELGYKNHQAMFSDLKGAYLQASRDLGNLRIIPGGQLFQYALKEGMKTVHRDTFHALIPHGRYLLSALWYVFFTDRSILDNRFCPEGMTAEELTTLKSYVNWVKLNTADS